MRSRLRFLSPRLAPALLALALLGCPPHKKEGFVAPPVNRTVATHLADSTRFIWDGPNAVQTGVMPGAIRRELATVLRGGVSDAAGMPLPDVTVTVLSGKQFGQTITRSDGRFDMVVNGGALLTVQLEKAGFVTVQRQVRAPRLDYSPPLDVVLLAEKSATPLMLGGAAQIVSSTVETDASGSRSLTLFVPSGTSATFETPTGDVAAPGVVNLRVTEFTVGDNGPRAMPGDLPQTSGYTYATELSLDEARGQKASHVRFDKTLYSYVDNFLSFPVGTVVPSGTYDRTRGLWVSEPSGRIVVILPATGGISPIDSDGDGSPDDDTLLGSLGFSTEERTLLATRYPTGATVWRVPLTHFTSFDLNWFRKAPGDATTPNSKPEKSGKDGDCWTYGSIIGCENRTLGELVGIPGTPFWLSYQSERTPGRKAAYTIAIPLTPATIPGSLVAVELEIRIAGQQVVRSFAPAPNLRETFTWDGKDVYGNLIQGTQPITVRVGYTYPVSYTSTTSFGEPPSDLSAITLNDARTQLTLWHEVHTTLGAWDARAFGFGGWSISHHHAYDPVSHAILYGDGRGQPTSQVGKTVHTIAGLGLSTGGENVPAKTAAVGIVRGIAFGGDGSLYFAEESEHRVRRIDVDGVLTTFAGTGTKGFGGDDGLATAAQLDSPFDVAFGPDGTLYVSDSGNHRIRAIGLDGRIRAFAGSGSTSDSGDGGLATAAGLSPAGITVAPDGTMYIADSDHHRVRRIGTNGIISTIAGDGTTLLLSFPQTVAVCPDGNIYFTDQQSHRIRAVVAGVLQTIAGTGFPGYDGDGGPAKDARLEGPTGIACGPDGTIYFTQSTNVRAVDPTGIIATIAGTGMPGDGGDDGPAAAAQFYEPTSLAVDATGDLVIGDSFRHRIRRIGAALPGLSLADVVIAGEAGTELYVFDSTGRHLRTLDGWTGTPLFTFEYDGNGRLKGIVDGDSNRTKIERSGSGDAKSITSAFGVATKLTVDSTTYLRKVENANGDSISFDYDSGGLLLGRTDPRGGHYIYAHDPSGLLFTDADPKGGTQTLASPADNSVTYTSPLGRTTTMSRSVDTSGASIRSVTSPEGLTIVSKSDPNTGQQTTTYPDGTVVTQALAPEPRFGMQVPIPALQTVKLPSGKQLAMTMTRSVDLSNANDPLSVITLTDVATRNGKSWQRVYDRAAATITLTSPMGRSAAFHLDARGRPDTLSLPQRATTALHYDGKGRVDSVTRGARSWSVSFDARSFLSSVSGPLAAALAIGNDAIGQPMTITAPGALSHSYTWDASSNLKSITNPKGGTYTYVLDAVDLPSTETEPALSSGPTLTTSFFDLERSPDHATLPDSSTISFGYDPSGRWKSLTAPGVAWATSYDAVGRLQTITQGGDGLAIGYDGAVATSIEWSGTVTGKVEYGVGEGLFASNETVNGGSTIVFTYDDDDLLTGAGALSLIRQPLTGAISGTTLGKTSESLTPDEFGAVGSWQASFDGALQIDRTLEHDDLGRIYKQTETLVGETHVDEYFYDAALRLYRWSRDGADVATYDYDDDGNRTTGGAVFDAQDRLTADSSATYSHDLLGRRTARMAAGAMTVYRWDGLDRLVGVDLPDGKVRDYVYDGVGARIAGRTNGSVTERYVYGDVFGPVAALDGGGAVVARFVYGRNAHVPDYVERDGNQYRIWSDVRGSPRLVVDVATGTIAQRMDYDVWGKVTNDTNPGFQPFGFAGGLYDPATGLTHFGAREYDAATGRWLSKDPVGRAREPNAYRYVGNDPVNWIDPSGLSPWSTFRKDFVDGFANAEIGGVLVLLDQQLVVDGVIKPCIHVNSFGFGVGSAFNAFSSIFTAGRNRAIKAIGRGGPPSKGFFDGTRYTDKVLRQMKGGVGEFHSFPESVTAFESSGTLKSITGGDGIVREMLEIPGSYEGREGLFQFIKEADGAINHRLFVPNIL